MARNYILSRDNSQRRDEDEDRDDNLRGMLVLFKVSRKSLTLDPSARLHFVMGIYSGVNTRPSSDHALSLFLFPIVLACWSSVSATLA